MYAGRLTVLSPAVTAFKEISVDVAALVIALMTMAACSLAIMLACHSYENASAFLGKHVYKMPSGVRGATIDAIGSSMPELFTTSFLLFHYMDEDGFSAGIATCAGSAVFNIVIIPALCILAVSYKGFRKNGTSIRLPYIHLKRSTLLRDGFFFMAAELLLIYFLGNSTLTWWMGGFLLVAYLVYFNYLMAEIWRAPVEAEADEEVQRDAKSSFTSKLVRLDFNGLFFGGRSFSAGSAWTVLLLATASIGIAAHFLAGAVMDSATALNVAPYFTAVILAAAATSVPDTVISVRSSLAGDYDDAISNAVGSNIFDICIALGVPLLVYGLIHGPVTLSAASTAANVQELRWALALVTVVVLGMLLINTPSKENRPGTVRVGKMTAFGLCTVYILWTTYIVGRGFGWPWLEQLVG